MNQDIVQAVLTLSSDTDTIGEQLAVLSDALAVVMSQVIVNHNMTARQAVAFQASALQDIVDGTNHYTAVSLIEGCRPC